MQVQTIPGAPIASYPGTLPGAQTPVAVIPQAPQQQVMVPTQQLPNNQVMYATAPTVVPSQAVVQQLVQPDPASLAAIQAPGVTPGGTVAGQTDYNTLQYGVPGIQQIVRKIFIYLSVNK